MNIEFTEQELEVINDLSERLGLAPEQVIRQGLRLYQATTLGRLKIVDTSGLSKADKVQREAWT